MQHEETTQEQVDHSAQQQSFIEEWSGDESDMTGEESAPPPPQRSHGRKHRDKEEKDYSAPPKVVREHLASSFVWG